MDIHLAFFADENISTGLIHWIRTNGYNISGVKEENMQGASDQSIIEMCFTSRRIIITHDNDFGKMVITHSIPFFSIIYLRPGHFDGNFHIPTMKSILKHKHLIALGTLIIGQRILNKIKIRIKHLE